MYNAYDAMSLSRDGKARLITEKAGGVREIDPTTGRENYVRRDWEKYDFFIQINNRKVLYYSNECFGTRFGDSDLLKEKVWYPAQPKSEDASIAPKKKENPNSGYWDLKDKKEEIEKAAASFTTAPTFDPVNKPKHYNSHPSGVQCITITEHCNFNVGNAIKYLWRCEHKNGLEDLEKARWYVDREIQRVKNTKEQDG